MTATSSSKPHSGGVEGGGGGAHRRLGNTSNVAARSEYEVEEMGHVVIRVDRGAKRPEVIAGRRGEPGHQDGGKGTSRLRNPTSVVLSDDGTSLIIIDTGNSAIRSLDLSTLEVSTLGGTPSEENTVETWLHMNDDLLSPAGSVSVVKTDGNGVWSTAFSHPVSSSAAELGEGDMTWTVRIQRSGKFGMRVGLAWVGSSCNDVRRHMGGFSMDWWTQGVAPWDNYLRFYYYSGGDGTLRDGGKTVHGPRDDDHNASGRHAAEWGFVTGDTVLMHLCTDDRDLGVLSFYLNGERVPGCIEGLPMEAIGCQGLTPCVSIATVGDAVRLYRGEREAGGAGSPVLQRGGGGAEGGGQHYFGESAEEAARRPWSAWADNVRVDGCVATATTDGPSAVLLGGGVSSGRHVAKLKIREDTGGLCMGVCDSNMPLYKSWSQSSFRDRAWFLCYHGTVRKGDEILMKQPVEFARGDLVGIELDMDHGTIEFSVNGRTIGPVTGVPDAGSGLVMHIAVCMFRAGDSIEATAGGRDYMLANAELVRKGKPGPLHVRSVHVHGPAWDLENRQFQLDWQNFRLLERLVTGELALIKEALLQVVDEVKRGTRIRGEREPCLQALMLLSHEESNIRILSCRILGELGVVNDGLDVCTVLEERSTREVEATAGVRWAARDALMKVEASEPLARWPEDRPLGSTRGLDDD